MIEKLGSSPENKNSVKKERNHAGKVSDFFFIFLTCFFFCFILNLCFFFQIWYFVLAFFYLFYSFECFFIFLIFFFFCFILKGCLVVGNVNWGCYLFTFTLWNYFIYHFNCIIHHTYFYFVSCTKFLITFIYFLSFVLIYF